ncbi:HTH-type transcriptional regulator Hpr [Texcoconibacillus texcoconensis]
MIFNQRMTQLSKALWKSIEKDWQQWIKPFNLNINEHHILWIAHHLEGASISDIAKFGVMHVSTAFNFSKKLEDRGLLRFSKNVKDKRNTYVMLTKDGNDLLFETLKAYDPNNYQVYKGSLPIKELYGKFPEFSELTTIVKHIYGEDFMVLFEKSLDLIDEDILEDENSVLSSENGNKSEPV